MEWFELFTAADFGWAGQLIPVVLVFCISWALSRKAKEVMFIQFPLMLAMKVMFPFVNPNIIILSLAIFIMNIVSSKGDILADMKNLATKPAERIAYTIKGGSIGEARRAIEKENRAANYQQLKANLRTAFRGGRDGN